MTFYYLTVLSMVCMVFGSFECGLAGLLLPCWYRRWCGCINLVFGVRSQSSHACLGAASASFVLLTSWPLVWLCLFALVAAAGMACLLLLPLMRLSCCAFIGFHVVLFSCFRCSLVACVAADVGYRRLNFATCLADICVWRSLAQLSC